MVRWVMHPWERDARWAHDVLHEAQPPFDIIVEIACTRSSEELLGARKAYHALYHHSLEEDVAYHVKENYSNVSSGSFSLEFNIGVQNLCLHTFKGLTI